MIALLGALFPFVRGLLGEGLVEKLLSHKRVLAESANGLEKAKLEADVRTIEHELSRRAMIKELQLKEYEHPFLWWPKFLVMFSFALYVTARLSVLTFGLDDFGVAVKPLDAWLEYLAGGVFGYMFLGDKISRAMRG